MTTVQTVVATRTITVRRINRFMRLRDAREVTWRDGGRRKRRILLTVDPSSSNADETVAAAVAATYPPDARPTVVVPASAWR